MKRILTCIVPIFLMLLGSCSMFHKETTDVKYLIPEGYEGDLVVLYNVPDAKPLEIEDGFQVVSFTSEGIAITSTKDMKYGMVNDQYFTVDKNGNRKKLDQSCIHMMSNGASTNHAGEPNEHTLPFNKLEITQSQCGPQFNSAGRKVPDNQAHPIEEKLEKLIQSVYDKGLIQQK
ncbi:hypothetical protein [Bacillus sp. TL12]|uniref:DUF6843 domain-containing protein n=1 Tax=Bacillus sp. TL12 TaxID=2894756 RepID=UPI001F522B35|nr:hypothetical protein [Bacillus sp. TL12]MCI0766935.1 hypothetical protein [Bacillus sp. TL12]